MCPWVFLWRKILLSRNFTRVWSNVRSSFVAFRNTDEKVKSSDICFCASFQSKLYTNCFWERIKPQLTFYTSLHHATLFRAFKIRHEPLHVQKEPRFSSTKPWWKKEVLKACCVSDSSLKKWWHKTVPLNKYEKVTMGCLKFQDNDYHALGHYPTTMKGEAKVMRASCWIFSLPMNVEERVGGCHIV